MSRHAASAALSSSSAAVSGLRVEFVMSDRYLDLMKGEADVALRSGDTDDGQLVGRKIGDLVRVLGPVDELEALRPIITG